MNYLQRFSRALAAMTDIGTDDRGLRKPRSQAQMEHGDWLGELHLVARRLPPRQPGDREHSS